MKLDNKKQIKRLVIYFFYDKDGVVDRYVPYMLNDINKNCSELFVVCNGKLTNESRTSLKKITPNVYVRPNEGFDVWAYKTALLHYGWEKLAQFDEIVMMNFTSYGPLYPFSVMFEEMDKRDVDFWGITKHHGFPFDPFGTIPCGYIPEHIQSSFICVRKNMLESIEFQEYWENMPPIHSYGEAVGKHEAIFTETFKNYGFSCDVYVNTDDLKDYTHYPLMIEPLELIKNRRCPVFKRKSFTNEYYEFLNACLGEPTVEMYEYIQKNFSYDLDMVWENLLRVENMADIKNRMHLNYILPRDITLQQSTECTKVALCMHLYFESEIEKCLNYAKSMPEGTDYYITTTSKEKVEAIKKAIEKNSFKNVTILQIENRGRDVSSLLVACAQFVSKYDLVCFVHDKKTTQIKPYTIGKSFCYKCFENILGSKDYVNNIITTFSNEKKLGMLMPPPPNHAAYYGIFGTEWASNFNNTKKLAEELGITSNMVETKEPISPLGTMFWFRPEALSDLFNKKWKYTDFPEEPNKVDGTILHAIERIYGFAAQNKGYYSGWCMNDKFSAIELTNYHFMLREQNSAIYSLLGYQDNCNMCNYRIYQKTFEDKKIQKQLMQLQAMQSFKTRIRLFLKRVLPNSLYKAILKTKRFFLGPHNEPLTMKEAWED